MMIKGSLASALILTGLSGIDSAVANYREGCESYYGSPGSSAKGEVLRLLRELPESSAVVICPNAKRSEGIFVLSPIIRNSGVSYYVSAYFETPADQSATSTDLVELTEEDPIVQSTMMALSSDPKIKHTSREFVETESISIGTFRKLFRLWLSVIETPGSANRSLDITRLDAGQNAAYRKFISSLNDHSRGTIKSIAYFGNDILEFPPRLSIEIEVNKRAWLIEFDLAESKKITLLEVHEQIE